MKRCVVCQGTLKTTVVEDTIAVDGHSFAAQVPAARCTKCGEDYVSAETLAQFELAVALRLADAGAASGRAFRFMRKSLGLKAVELASLLDVTQETLSRWETGKLAVPKSSAALLAAMVRDSVGGRTTTRDQLARLGQPEELGASQVAKFRPLKERDPSQYWQLRGRNPTCQAGLFPAR